MTSRIPALNRAASIIRLWWKCKVRGLHFYKFVEKRKDGSRLLRCVRCPKTISTAPRTSNGWMA